MVTSFVIAPAGERTLTAGAYLVGALELTVLVAALAFGAYRVRALLLPGWSGAPARLAESVLAVAGLIWVSEALGTFGGFEEGALLGAVVVVGVVESGCLGRQAAVLALKLLQLAALRVGVPPGVDEVDHRVDVGEQDQEEHQDQDHAPELVPVDPARRPSLGPPARCHPIGARAHAPWFGARALPSCKGADPRV